MRQKRYKRDYESKHDKQQAKLDFTSPTLLKQTPKEIIAITSLRTGNYACPFCLHSDIVEHYLISTKKGYHKGLGKCPECGHQMQLKTLFADMTPEQFAQFAYDYSGSGYWQKVPFAKFNRRLDMMGWLARFWNEYKKLKGDDPNEKYQDYMMRVQEDEARAQGLLGDNAHSDN